MGLTDCVARLQGLRSRRWAAGAAARARGLLREWQQRCGRVGRALAARAHPQGAVGGGGPLGGEPNRVGGEWQQREGEEVLRAVYRVAEDGRGGRCRVAL